VAIVAAIVVALLMLSPGIGFSCAGPWPLGDAACGSTADQYEPNDELQTATPLPPGTPLSASIGRGGSRGDFDIFQCDAPGSVGSGRFRVEVESDHAQDLEVQVGASIPGVFEAITWPGWQPVTTGNVITLQGELRKGTVLIFITGSRRVDYVVRIVWE
jgi:hypothetical protein